MNGTYRAVVGERLGPPDTYRLVDLPRHPLEPHQVRIALSAARVSFVDVLTAAGEYQVKPPVPYVPGSEAAGTILECGAAVTDLTAGDRVVVTGMGGMFAQEVVLPQRLVRRIPDTMPFDEAAVFPVSYITAWHALVDRGAIRRGETVLVLGAGGATGHAAVQIAHHLGAHVIASASSTEKRALAQRCGAGATVVAGAPDWHDQVKAAAAGRPVDIVFDPVGGDATDPAFRSLGWRGRHLIVGFPGGIATLRTNLPLLKGASLIGVDVRQFGEREPDRAEAARAEIYDLAAAGVLRPVIARRYPLDAFADAMTEAAAGSAAGRVVIEIGGRHPPQAAP